MGSSASSTASHLGGGRGGHNHNNPPSSSSHNMEGTIVTGTTATTARHNERNNNHNSSGNSRRSRSQSRSRNNRGVPTSIPSVDVARLANRNNNSNISLNSDSNNPLLLNRPYPILQRTQTESTSFVEGGAFPTIATTDWTSSSSLMGGLGGSERDLSSSMNLPLSMPPHDSMDIINNNNNSATTPLMMRRVRSSGGASSSASSSVGMVVSHNTNNNREMSVFTSPPTDNDGKLPPSYPSNSAVAANAMTTSLNPTSEVNARLDTQVEVRVYPCNNNNGNSSSKKKFTQFTVKPEGVIIQGTNRRSDYDLGSEYARHIGRKLQRYELADTRACQLLVTSHAKSFWVVPAPEAFSRHSGTCRLLGDRKHPPTAHTLQVGDFLRVGSVGVVVIETHDGVHQKSLSEERIQKIMRDTASGGFIDLGETDGENSDVSKDEQSKADTVNSTEEPICYMCFDESDEEDNPLITPCKCLGDTRFVHVECLRKWHTAEADNQICFLSSVDATCSVCKSTFKSDFKLRNGKLVKLFKSSLEPPYVSLLIATKHEMAQRLFNTRFQLSFHTILKPDRKNSTRPLLMGRSSGSDMVLDYRTVSARHASIRFKNGEFIFSDAGSSNGSYLYLRRPVELTTTSQSVQFRLGRSMISMKVVNKWNRRLLRAVRRSHSNSSAHTAATDDHSIGSEEEINITDELTGMTYRSTRRTRDSIMQSLPAVGSLLQTSPQHLDLLHALAYPRKNFPNSDTTMMAMTRHSILSASERKRLLNRSTTSLPNNNTTVSNDDINIHTQEEQEEEQQQQQEEETKREETTISSQMQPAFIESPFSGSGGAEKDDAPSLPLTPTANVESMAGII